jgi:hypothetical protein
MSDLKALLVKKAMSSMSKEQTEHIALLTKGFYGDATFIFDYLCSLSLCVTRDENSRFRPPKVLKEFQGLSYVIVVGISWLNKNLSDKHLAELVALRITGELNMDVGYSEDTIVGRHADFIIIDDPLNPKGVGKALSILRKSILTALKAVYAYNKVMSCVAKEFPYDSNKRKKNRPDKNGVVETTVSG